jgi:hypothetical protein
LKKSEWFLLLSDEPFNVLLRTIATNHRLSNALHGGTSISWTSPPLANIILSSLPLPVKKKLGELDYTDSEKKITQISPF